MEEHFLQSEAWAKFQHDLGHATIRKSGDGWAYLAVIERSRAMTRLYCPYGPTVRSLAALDAAIDDMKTEAARVHAAFLRLQPVGVTLRETEATQRGLQAIAYSQPVATRVIDLAPDFDQILAAMNPSKRNVCRNYQKKGLSYHQSRNPADVEQLLPLLHDVAVRNNITVHSDDYLRTQAAALLPEHASIHIIQADGEAISAALVFEGETVNYYAHAGTSSAHRKTQPNTALIGELLKYSKDQGKTAFDLYGVAPNDDPNHPWAGVTNFKAEFGGRVVHYNPTYDLPLKKARYTLYHTLRQARRKRA